MTPAESLPISIAPGSDYDNPVVLDQFHRTISTKNLPQLAIHTLVNDVEAIFINIHWGSKHQNLGDVEKLPLESSKLINKGLVFIWAPKQGLGSLLKIMVHKGFSYVENLEVINLDFEKARKAAGKSKDQKDQPDEALIKGLEKVDPNDLMAEEEREYFRQTKRTLLIFRKVLEC